MKHEAVSLGQRQGAQVLDETLHDPGRLEDWLEVLSIRRVDAVEQGFDVALDHGERCAELVRNVGQGRLPLLLDLLQARAHRVERAGEVADFARAFLSHAGAEVAGFDPARGLDQLPDGYRRPADVPAPVPRAGR